MQYRAQLLPSKWCVFMEIGKYSNPPFILPSSTVMLEIVKRDIHSFGLIFGPLLKDDLLKKIHFPSQTCMTQCDILLLLFSH